MSLTHKIWTATDFANESKALAALRITVFRDFPYLYDGNVDYETDYLKSYQHPDAIVVAVYDHQLDQQKLVGAATGSPLSIHDKAFAQPFIDKGHDIESIFYCGESVLLSDYRGQGIGHLFFDAREAKAKDLGKQWICFCSVIRDDKHPLRPTNYRPLDGFWQKRGYRKLDDVLAEFRWQDVGESTETTKSLQFWIKRI